MTGTRFLVGSAVWLFACISLLATLTTACATIVVGVAGDDETEFSSEPSGAVITVANGQSCTTPCKLVVRPIVNQQVKATLDGYDDKEDTLVRRIAYPFWGNILFGSLGLITAAIDWLDHHIWTYESDKVHFALASDAEEAAKAPPTTVPQDVAESAALGRLKKSYPEDYMLEQIRNYYGGQTAEVNQNILARLYKLMLQMQTQGDDVNVDEAVRQDRFEQLREPVNEAATRSHGHHVPRAPEHCHQPRRPSAGRIFTTLLTDPGKIPYQLDGIGL